MCLLCPFFFVIFFFYRKLLPSLIMTPDSILPVYFRHKCLVNRKRVWLYGQWCTVTQFKEWCCDERNKEERSSLVIQNKWPQWKFVNFETFFSYTWTYFIWFGDDSSLKSEKAMATPPVLWPGKSHGRRSLVGCSPWGREELDTTEQLRFHFSLSCTGEGNGNPLQCSLPGESQGRGSLVGCRLGGRTESDTTEVTQQQQPQHHSRDCHSFFPWYYSVPPVFGHI